ncbi:MAG: 30S ribosomal protein S18 [Bdellovibrionales bacterium]|nr:30S ribosomal protein S18 [Bdellovibrionales bacterium]
MGPFPVNSQRDILNSSSAGPSQFSRRTIYILKRPLLATDFYRIETPYSEFPGDVNFDYKDPVTLGRFLMEGGKIIPSRISKLSFSQQKAAAAAVKKARNLALLPQGTIAYDANYRAEAISPRPFEI